ncbi:hypothetical protein H0H81_012712 [Sphagnurus paluster]|uniref:SH3 domain-containing protein n=1 Tax=Sphagnurus paluster TaxID=117069 RepID=A0A9P7GV51_9AGAR|nr:hypothetical protein H0H81_012712 [Sphagnurus paluster]
MKLNSPVPQPLSKECIKAARICDNNGLDGVIPRSVLENARGFAIFTIFKAGFLFSARAGSGLVIARLDDGTWSAPSAIGTAGVGVGGQVGAEMTDFLVVLNTRSAVQTFMASGSLTLGGNLSIALGPLGRNGEALGSLNTSGKVAAMYSYSKTRGLFAGISAEGSVIVERQDANATAYRSPVTARMLLGGAVERPEWASLLIQTLESCTGLPGGRKWIQDGVADGAYTFGGVSSPGAEHTPSKKQKGSNRPSFPPSTWGSTKNGGSYFSSSENMSQTSAPTGNRGHVTSWDHDDPSFPFEAHFESDFTPSPQPTRLKNHRLTQSVSNTSITPLDMSYDNPAPSSRLHARSYSMSPRFTHPVPASNPFASDSILGIQEGDEPTHSVTYITPKPQLRRPLHPHEGVARAIALYEFRGVEAGDLSFSKGDVITITQKSDSSDDWYVESRHFVARADLVVAQVDW